MNVIIHGHHLDVTPALRGYVEGKLERVRRHFDHLIEANVMLTVDKLEHRAAITLGVRGTDLHAECVEPDMYAAIDNLMNKLDRQVLRHKDRVRGVTGPSMKYQLDDTEQ